VNGTARTDGPSEPGPPRIDARRIDAVVVDADAVLTDSSPLRAAAWADAMQAFLGQYAHVTGDPQTMHPPVHLTPDQAALLDPDIAAVLLRQQTGRIDLAAEHLGPSEADLVPLLAAEGARRFRDLIQERSLRCRPGAYRLLRALRAEGIAVAAVSTTRHGALLVRTAGLAGFVAVCVDARDADFYGLGGPPSPAMLRLALGLLRTDAGRAAAVAGSLPYLAAAEGAPFGLSILARPSTHPLLRPAPAGRVGVQHLGDVTVGAAPGG
jgi:beta-phosphoglucomutase-like phosphatase (HAD superfamily)